MRATAGRRYRELAFRRAASDARGVAATCGGKRAMPTWTAGPATWDAGVSGVCQASPVCRATCGGKRPDADVDRRSAATRDAAFQECAQASPVV